MYRSRISHPRVNGVKQKLRVKLMNSECQEFAKGMAEMACLWPTLSGASAAMT